MDEKTMVSDALVGINGELKAICDYITQTENPQLKQTLKQMRNKTETAQSSCIRSRERNPICACGQGVAGRNRACKIFVQTGIYAWIRKMFSPGGPSALRIFVSPHPYIFPERADTVQAGRHARHHKISTVSAAIHSTTTTALGTMMGSWRPRRRP